MRKFILILLMCSICSIGHAQTTLTASDETFIKKTRLLKQLEKQLVDKIEEERIAISVVKTTFQSDKDAIKVQITTTETELEALIP